MTLTKDHTQMLATLAAACRPNGARRWDSAGVLAALEKVKDRDLAEVIMATVRAAVDRECETPGVIPTNGSHWRDTAVIATPGPQRVDKADRCGICSKSRSRCPRERVADDDHAFEPSTAKPPTIDVPRTVKALKDEVTPTAPRPDPQGLDALTSRRPELAARVAAVVERNPGLAMSDEAVGDA